MRSPYILLVLILSSPGLAQELVPGVDIFFAYNGVIVRQYFTGYDKNEINAWRRANPDSLPPKQPMSWKGPRVPISLSKSWGYFKIKPGYSVHLFDDSKLVKSSKVQSFYSQYMDGNGNRTFLMLPDSSEQIGFAIILREGIDFRKVYHPTSIEESSVELDQICSQVLKDYFMTNRSILRRQLTGRTMIDTTVSNDEFNEIIENRMILSPVTKYRSLNADHLYAITGENTMLSYRRIFALFNEEGQLLFVKNHSCIENVLHIGDNFYIVISGYVPDTGMRGYGVLKITGDRVIEVWSDWSMST